MDLDGSKGVKSSVSYADSSFAKGAIGDCDGRKSVANILIKFRGSSKFFLCWYCFHKPFFRLSLQKMGRNL